MCSAFRVLLVIVLAIVYPGFTNSQSTYKIQKQVILLKRTIELNHYSPRPVDNHFSEQLFDKFLARLDEDKQFFTPADFNELLPYRSQLDEELNGKGWQFFDKLISVYKSRLQKKDSAIAKKKEAQLLHRHIRKVLDHPSGYENYLAAIYCDVLANSFDPHTEYMPLEEKQDFDASLGTEGYYFGFSLEENENGDTEIGRLMPGSPAWKSGDLNKGDVITKIGWEGKEQVEVAGIEPDELSELLDGSNTDKLQITVRKANGIEKTTSLIKEKIDNEENNVKGYVLKGPESIGYIYLPDFYTGHEGSNGSCANDVAKEIVKLKKENIRGLILDVRYNGGGSLQEALDMAGIFIDAGPLSMIREKSGKIISLKDMNRGTIYDGPMTLLVNSQSASASELLGAVLQDYNRAVVVGSTTFGKGSAQVIFPVDTSNLPLASRNTEYGFVKITISKFYRVNGRTTQHAGVTPDVALPDIFDGMNYHEAALPAALPSDTIKKNAYYTPLLQLPLGSIVEKSDARVNHNKKFQLIRKYNMMLKDTVTLTEEELSLTEE